MTPEEVKAYVDGHDPEEYTLVDVREDWEYEEFHLPGAKWIPLSQVPDRHDEIPGKKRTVVYCASGVRSAAAAKILTGKDVGDLYHMAGGIMAWKSEYAVGSQEFGLIYLSGKESPLEILSIAFFMEDNLGDFYRRTAASVNVPELQKTLNRLAAFEEAHKTKIFKMANAIDPTLDDRSVLEGRKRIEALEGGMTAEEILKLHPEFLASTRSMIEAAMLFEAQALDLYMRHLDRVPNQDAAKILRELVKEEKNHLKILAGLMRKDIVD
jgi:rhodanese-related sulfurtransferase/rubrerythrin